MMQLTTILDDLRNNIADFIKKSQNKTVVFDFDGTLTKFKYGEDSLLPCKRQDFVDFVSSGGNFYKNVVMQKTMLYIIEQIGYENVWILTTSVPEIRELKAKVILENLNIMPEHIIHSDSDAHKVELLKDLHNKEKKDIIFVEDTIYTIISAEDNLDYVKGYHISSMIP